MIGLAAGRVLRVHHRATTVSFDKRRGLAVGPVSAGMG
jgi:hypothetical protein